MLFGQSVFQSVLTRLDEEEKHADETGMPQAAGFRIRGLGTGFVAQTTAHAGATEADLTAYFDYLPDENDDMIGTPDTTGTADAAHAAAAADDTSAADVEPPPEPPVMPDHLLRISAAEIAEDLDLKPEDGEQALNDKRRRFAKQNHPDRVAPQFRDQATLRMQTANLLVDRAIRLLSLR